MIIATQVEHILTTQDFTAIEATAHSWHTSVYTILMSLGTYLDAARWNISLTVVGILKDKTASIQSVHSFVFKLVTIS